MAARRMRIRRLLKRASEKPDLVNGITYAFTKETIFSPDYGKLVLRSSCSHRRRAIPLRSSPGSLTRSKYCPSHAVHWTDGTSLHPASPCCPDLCPYPASAQSFGGCAGQRHQPQQSMRQPSAGPAEMLVDEKSATFQLKDCTISARGK